MAAAISIDQIASLLGPWQERRLTRHRALAAAIDDLASRGDPARRRPAAGRAVAGRRAGREPGHGGGRLRRPRQPRDRRAPPRQRHLPPGPADGGGAAVHRDVGHLAHGAVAHAPRRRHRPHDDRRTHARRAARRTTCPCTSCSTWCRPTATPSTACRRCAGPPPPTSGARAPVPRPERDRDHQRRPAGDRPRRRLPPAPRRRRGRRGAHLPRCHRAVHPGRRPHRARGHRRRRRTHRRPRRRAARATTRASST